MLAACTILVYAFLFAVDGFIAQRSQSLCTRRVQSSKITESVYKTLEIVWIDLLGGTKDGVESILYNVIFVELREEVQPFIPHMLFACVPRAETRSQTFCTPSARGKV